MKFFGVPPPMYITPFVFDVHAVSIISFMSSNASIVISFPAASLPHIISPIPESARAGQ